MNKFHHDFNTEAKSVTMTDVERARLRVRFVAHMQENPASAAVRSPYAFNMLFTMRAGVAALLAVLVIGGSATAYAADSALPGDTLYAVKVDVNEPVALALAVSPEAKGAAHAAVATERLHEAQTLATQGRLDATTSDALAADFTAHADAVATIADDLRSSDPTASAQLSSGFSSALALNGAALLRSGDDSGDGSRESAARLVRAAVGATSGELALATDDASDDHARSFAPQAAVMTQQADQGGEQNDNAPSPVPAATVSVTAPRPALMKAMTMIASATSTNEAASTTEATSVVAVATTSTTLQSAPTDADKELSSAIEAAATSLDDARPSLDASTTAALDSRVNDLRLIPLAIQADEAAGNGDEAAKDRGRGIRAAATLHAFIAHTATHAKKDSK